MQDTSSTLPVRRHLFCCTFAMAACHVHSWQVLRPCVPSETVPHRTNLSCPSNSRVLGNGGKCMSVMSVSEVFEQRPLCSWAGCGNHPLTWSLSFRRKPNSMQRSWSYAISERGMWLQGAGGQPAQRFFCPSLEAMRCLGGGTQWRGKDLRESSKTKWWYGPHACRKPSGLIWQWTRPEAKNRRGEAKERPDGVAETVPLHRCPRARRRGRQGNTSRQFCQGERCRQDQQADSRCNKAKRLCPTSRCPDILGRATGH